MSTQLFEMLRQILINLIEHTPVSYTHLIRQLGFGQHARFADMRAVQDVAVALPQLFHRLRNVGFDRLRQGGKRIK